MVNHRISAVRRIMQFKKIDMFLINNIKNISYLTGFTGSSGFVVLTKDKSLFFTDFRYKEQAEKEVLGCEIRVEKDRRIKVLTSLINKLGITSLGFETSIPYEFYEQLKKLPVTLSPQRDIIENLRKIKDEVEISNIKLAVQRAEKAFLKIKPRIKAGVKELEIALRLEEQLKKEGSRHIPFDIIVASGKNSSMPHAKPTEKKIEKGDFVIIDFGAEAMGYYSDITRTFIIKGGSFSEKAKIYNIVNNARKKAIEAVRAGINTKLIDKAARDFIKEAGYGEFFGHGLGHGIGMDVHESPRISWTKGEKVLNGQVFTVEPGIYIPGVGGVRIEDIILVKNGVAELLTSLNRDLEIIGNLN